MVRDDGVPEHRGPARPLGDKSGSAFTSHASRKPAMTRTSTHAASQRPRLTQPLLLLAFTGLAWPGIASAQPSQRPLLVTNTGAKPNIVFSLDNSGSMAFPYPDGYVMRIRGDRADTQNLKGFATFAAQRSAVVNSMYYNPRVKYEPRVDADGKPLPDDGLVFVSNADSATMWHSVFAKSEDSARAGGPVFTTDNNFTRWSAPAKPADYSYIWFLSVYTSEWLPVNVAYTASEAAARSPTPTFSYARCSAAELKKIQGEDANGNTVELPVKLCADTKPDIVDVKYGSSELVPLPENNGRYECKPSRDQAKEARYCTNELEVANILNWYRYYRNRMEATKTALGQALQSDRLKGGAARLGYRNINMGGLSVNTMPALGSSTQRPQSLRGVRPWADVDKKQFFDWLYGTYPGGGTPMRKAYRDIAAYFQGAQADAESPWAQDPSRPANNSADAKLRNPELSCRRSYQVALSDGGWNDEDLKGQAAGDSANQDASAGPSFARIAPSPPLGAKFSYSPKGSTQGSDRYIAYPGSATGGLADLAANYYWHTDLRPDLPNNVPTRFLYPPFWQHLQTFTIGYMIRPSGENGQAGGLSFRQIDAYRNQYFLNAATWLTAPSWPAAGDDLRTTEWNSAFNTWQFTRPESDRVDDFIQSGYTGGGRSFSVTDALGIRSAVDTILADILDASGNDAGIALGAAAGATDPLKGRLKFKVDYRTTDNVGDVTAEELDSAGRPVTLTEDASGNKLSPASTTYWSAEAQLQRMALSDRKLYTIGSDGVGVALSGALKDLPASVQDALRTGPHAADLPEDKRFIDYLRGADPVADKKDQLYRLRASRIGAIANGAPILLGASVNYGYQSKTSTVAGKNTYADFRSLIARPPETLFAASNAGVVHALNAANGQEIAAYMPRRSMRRLLDQAQVDSEFRYVLDGPLTTNDIYDGASWNQVVVGSGGRGERVIYALRPRLDKDGQTQLARTDYLWETGPDLIDNADVAIGYMSNPARSGQTASGEWVIVLNSGHDNGLDGGRRHGLVVLDAMTGQVLRTIPLPKGYSAGNRARNGLGGVTLVRDARMRIVAAYAGDAQGQLWRFDLSGPPASWRVSYDKPLFQTQDARPIYAAPAWQAHPKGGRIVVVATGMLLHDADTLDTAHREGIYGIWDPTSAANQEAADFNTIQPDQLLEQKVQELGKSETVGNASYYSITRNKINWEPGGHKGWQLQLGGWKAIGDTSGTSAQAFEMSRPGERVIDAIANYGSSVRINSVVVNGGLAAGETCTSASPASASYLLNALDGAGKPALDANRDGKLDAYSMVFVSTGGFARSSASAQMPLSTKNAEAQQGNGSGAAAEQLGAQGGNKEDNGEGTTPDDTDPDGDASKKSSRQCQRRRTAAAGTGTDIFTFGIDCPTQAWSRQQYQLTQRPQ